MQDTKALIKDTRKVSFCHPLHTEPQAWEEALLSLHLWPPVWSLHWHIWPVGSLPHPHTRGQMRGSIGIAVDSTGHTVKRSPNMGITVVSEPSSSEARGFQAAKPLCLAELHSNCVSGLA